MQIPANGEQSHYLLTEEDWNELQVLISAVHGTGELILYSGDETFLPEMRTENMASIFFTWSGTAKHILGRAKVVT